jgi:hypothetical protein
MKKVLLVLVLVGVSMAGFMAETAWADARRHGHGHDNDECSYFRGEKRWGDKGHDRSHFPRDISVSQVPQEIKDKWAEADKLAVDLRLELGKNPINRGKVLELRAKRRALKQEISDWHFNEKLNALEAK